MSAKIVSDLADRVHATGFGRRFAHRQSDVDRFGIEPGIEGGGAKRVFRGCDGGRDAVFQSIDRRALRLAFVRRHRSERFQER